MNASKNFRFLSVPSLVQKFSCGKNSFQEWNLQDFFPALFQKQINFIKYFLNNI